MGVAAPIIGGVGTIMGIAGQQSSQRAQAAAAADQSSMLAKQAFMNSLALNSVQTNLAYDFDTADLQQRSADLQAVQQNFQALMGARQQHLANSGQVDQGRYQLQKQYFDTIFQQGQQSTGTAFNSSVDMNNRFFNVGVQGMQAMGQATQAGMNNMFGTAANAMRQEQQVSTAGLSNMFNTDVKGITDVTNTALSGAQNVFDTTNAARSAYTNASVNSFETQSRGFQQGTQVSEQLEEQQRQIQAQEAQVTQQQSAMEAVYSAMIGGSSGNTLSGANVRDRAGNQNAEYQIQSEQTANNAINSTTRNASYANRQASLEANLVGGLGGASIANAAIVSDLNNQNIGSLSLMNSLNALGNYGRDTSFARQQGALDTSKAAADFSLDTTTLGAQNQLQLDYQGFQNSMENSFLRDYLGQQDRYAQNNANSALQMGNANLNNFLRQSLGQKQAQEMAYQQGNAMIGNQSMDNRLASMLAMQTGMQNARLQSDANATINQGQQAALRAQRSSGGGAGMVGGLLSAGLGIYQGLQGRGGGQTSGFSTTPYNQSSFNNGASGGGFFSNMGLYGSSAPAASYDYAPASLGLGTFQ